MAARCQSSPSEEPHIISHLPTDQTGHGLSISLSRSPSSSAAVVRAYARSADGTDPGQHEKNVLLQIVRIVRLPPGNTHELGRTTSGTDDISVSTELDHGLCELIICRRYICWRCVRFTAADLTDQGYIFSERARRRTRRTRTHPKVEVHQVFF